MEHSVNNSVTLEDAAHIIAHTGDTTTTILLGEPGVGKSSLRERILSILGWSSDQMVYLDAPLLDFPDFFMPDVQNNVTTNAYHARWHLNSDKPQLYMIDEIGKMQGITKPMITRFLLERTVSDAPIPDGSIIFATSNLSTDGVGDNIPAHMFNRMSTLNIIKPDHEAVLAFGTEHGMNGTLLYFIRETPELCQSYADLDPEDLATNKYIFNPRTNTKAFVSNRSLWMASRTLDKMESGHLTKAQAMAHICGAIGSPATAELWATVELADQLPTRQSIYGEPTRAKVPDAMSAQILLGIRLASGMNSDNIAPTTVYMQRLEPEIQAITGRLLFQTKAGMVMRHAPMRDWVNQFVKEYA